MQDVSHIKSILAKEFEQNSTITLQSVYKILSNELPEIEMKKRNYRVRSLIDNMLRSKKIRRIAPSTYQKIT